MAKTGKEIVAAVCAESDADILVYWGDIQRFSDDELIAACRRRRRRKNALMFVSTFGGDPSAAYRIARAIQHAYKTREQDPSRRGQFIIVVDTVCKSAGTLLCLGATRLIMPNDAELGPIDVQLRKPEEIGERTSGLTPVQAMDTLQNQSITLFKRHFRQLRFDGELGFSTKAAAEIATNLSVGLLGPVYAQIDPIRLAEVERSLRISAEYGQRIESTNVKEGGLARLLANYPSHGFVIDKTEAAEIFKQVEDVTAPQEEFIELYTELSQKYVYGNSAFTGYICEEPSAPNPPSTEGQDNGQAKSDGPAAENPGGEQPEVRQAAGGASEAAGATASTQGAPW